jgi:hypothetical protein
VKFLSGLSLAAFLIPAAPSPTWASHCFSIWKYPHAQRCGGNNQPPVVRIAKRMTVPAMAPPQAPGPSFDIPLSYPDPAMILVRQQLDGMMSAAVGR